MEQSTTVARTVLGLAAVFALSATASAAEPARPITVFAASSLQNALKDIGSLFVKAGGAPVAFNFSVSPLLAQKIQEGAVADIFIPADEASMDEVEKRGLLHNGTRSDLLSNRLALVAGRDSSLRLKIAPWFPLLQALGGEKLAMASEATALGQFGRDALTKMHVWTQVQGQIARADAAQTPVGIVAHGQAPLGVAYDTDAAAEPLVRVVDVFPETSHPRSVYPAAVLKSAGPSAMEFLRFLGGPDARAVFQHYGFKRP